MFAWFFLSLHSLFVLLSSILLASVHLLPPACGLAVLQAASQEQVDNVLQENDALRTNLAALEQVTKPRLQRTSHRL